MPASYPSFATPQQFSALTGIDPAPPGTQELLDAASSTIRRYCGWHISPIVTEDVVIDGLGGSTVCLPTLRLLDLTAVEEIWNPSTTYAHAPSDLEFSRHGYMRKISGGQWTTALRGITATIEHGFDPADCGDLAQMTCSIAARALTSPPGVASQTVGSVAVSFAATADGAVGGVSLYESQMAQLDALRLFGRP